MSDQSIPSYLAAEAIIKLLNVEPGFAAWWATNGATGQAYFHDKMVDKIKAHMLSDEDCDACGDPVASGDLVQVTCQALSTDLRRVHRACFEANKNIYQPARLGQTST